MTNNPDNETWLIESAGDRVIQKMAHEGIASFTPWELLVYCLWVADYGMRNAGDLSMAFDVYANFQSDGKKSADALSLQQTAEAFALDLADFEREYFVRFDSVCDEIRLAEQRS